MIVLSGWVNAVSEILRSYSPRVVQMDQRPYPGPSLLFHVRMSTLFVILWTTDFLMLLFAVENTLEYGVGGMVLFACEASYHPFLRKSYTYPNDIG